MAGIDGFGTKLQRGDGGSPEIFTAIANVKKIDGPEIKRDTIDTTDHDSPDEWEEVIGSIKRSGEIQLDLNYHPSKHDVLVADIGDKTPRNYKIIFPDTALSTWTFQAIFIGFKPSAPSDDMLSATLTIKVTGKPTLS
jgi:predicted secreted protein